jgi:alkylhydroperoxidase/carboxymuconolactone decarboxylase family protein YurZ
MADEPEIPFYDFETNFDRGVALLREVYGDEFADSMQARKGNPFGDFTTAVAWGWVFQRPHLSRQQRALILLTVEVARGGFAALRDHLRWALHEGITRDQVRELMFMLNLYNGWPATREANAVVNLVFAELDKIEKDKAK